MKYIKQVVSISFFLLPAFMLLSFNNVQHSVKKKTIKVLIVDGQNNHHNWKQTTPALREILTKRSSDCEVDVVSAPAKKASADAWNKFDPDFKKYDVVLLNYYGSDWPKKIIDNYLNYVSKGGGTVMFHAAVASFPKNEKFNTMIGLGWRRGAGHSKRHAFTVDIKNKTHPIMKGFKGDSFEHNVDEMYHNLTGPKKNMTVLASAMSPNIKKEVPLIWTVDYEKGRCFVTVLGHDTKAMESEGFKETLFRGVEWAAKKTSNHKAETSSTIQNDAWVNTVNKHMDKSLEVYEKFAPIKLPLIKGVKAWNPTAIVKGPNNVMYVANYTGEIYSLVDSDGDGLEDTAKLFCNVTNQKLRYPTCMAWQGNDLYVGTTQEIHIYTDKNGDGVVDSNRTFFKDFPWTLHAYDWTFGLCFGPDKHVYVIFCTDGLNRKAAPDPKGYRGAIVKISPNGKKSEKFATGLRFSFGMQFNELGDIFFTDNKSGGNPTEEFNHAPKGSYHGHDPNKKYVKDYKNKVETLVKVKNGYGSGGLGFNTLTNEMYMACWGPDGNWNKGSIIKFKLRKKSDGQYVAKEYPVVKNMAKVIDIAFNDQGDMYVAQFGIEGRGHTPSKSPQGSIYRFVKAPWVTPAHSNTHKAPIIEGDAAKGKLLFEQRACSSCHGFDPEKQTYGPSLDSVGDMFDKGQILAAINDPSNGIKSGYESTEIKTKDGKTHIGRLMGSTKETITLMVVGNKLVTLSRLKIKSTKTNDTSLMPPNLLTGMSDDDINNLLAYLKVKEVGANKSGTGKLSKRHKAIYSSKNYAIGAKASSPDSLKEDGSSGGDIAAIDGNDETYWDEVDGKKLYKFRVTFSKKTSISAISIKGFAHHSHSPKSFKILIDGKVVKDVKNAQYANNILVVEFSVKKCKKIQLDIYEYYGGSPGIRELKIYNVSQ